MRIRELQDGDLEAVQARSSKPYDKLNAPERMEVALVGLDDDGQPRIVIAAEKVAELYMVLDHDFETPAMRWAMIEQIHREMLWRLERKGYTVGYSFLPDGVPNGYARRLVNMGWTRIVERCLRFVAGRV